MTLNPTFRKVLIISSKQAVGALVGSTLLAGMFPSTFNLHDMAHFYSVLKAVGSIVLSAEAKVWLPRIMEWVKSPTNGEVVQP